MCGRSRFPEAHRASLEPLAVQGCAAALPAPLPPEGPDIMLLVVGFLQHMSASEVVLSSVGQAVPFDGFSPGGKVWAFTLPPAGFRRSPSDDRAAAAPSGTRSLLTVVVGREGRVWAEPTVVHPVATVPSAVMAAAELSALGSSSQLPVWGAKFSSVWLSWPYWRWSGWGCWAEDRKQIPTRPCRLMHARGACLDLCEEGPERRPIAPKPYAPQASRPAKPATEATARTPRPRTSRSACPG